MLSLPAAAVSVTQAESNQNCSQHRAQRQRQHLGRYAGEGSKIAIITIRERNEDTEQSNTFPVLLLLLLLFVCFQYINSFTLSHSKVMTRSHVIQKEKKKKLHAQPLFQAPQRWDSTRSHARNTHVSKKKKES